MSESPLRSQVIALVDTALGRHGSEENRTLLVSKVAKMPFDNDDGAKKSMRRIRMAISLLVSEELADDIYEEMLALAETNTDERSTPY